MKYLFFDIECADGGKATICSFGYVITDMDFNILDHDDILMNPEGRFYLTGRAGRPDVNLAYPIEHFKNAPNFKAFVNGKLSFEPESYLQNVEVDASQIGAAFRPNSVLTQIWYTERGSDDPYTVITQHKDGGVNVLMGADG